MNFIFNGVDFDDCTLNEDGSQWSQICDKCLIKYDFKKNKIDEQSGSGTCGIKGCVNEADHYIDF